MGYVEIGSADSADQYWPQCSRECSHVSAGAVARSAAVVHMEGGVQCSAVQAVQPTLWVVKRFGFVK
jgi:hypothetical protein